MSVLVKKIAGIGACLIAFFSATPLIASNASLVQPPVSMQSPHGVNILQTQVQVSHKGVSIGGALGLEHSFSTLEGSWAGSDQVPSGPQDRYEGMIFCVFKTDRNLDRGYYIIASDGQDTKTFNPGESRNLILNPNEKLFAIEDRRVYLKYDVSGSRSVLYKADGTRVFYNGFDYTNLNNCQDRKAFMTQIHHPNGLIVTTAPRLSVTTNTGYHLRYYLVPVPPALDQKQWYSVTPRYIVGLNRAVVECPLTYGQQLNTDCATNGWPRSEYIWVGNNLPIQKDFHLTIVDPDGTRTRYTQEQFPATPPCNICTVSRLTKTSKVDSAGNAILPGSAIVYSLSNDPPSPHEYLFTFHWPSQLGVLRTSTQGEYTISYSRNITSQQTDINSSGYKAGFSIRRYPSDTAPGPVLGYVLSNEYSVYYDTQNRSRMQSYFNSLENVKYEYGYDNRDNVTSVTARGVTQRAEYEPECNDSNFRYCNSPKWVSDFKPEQNKTFYTYHPESGQVQTITYPPDKKGISKKVRYGYELKFASYFQGGVKKPAPSGIWLKTSERTCARSATLDNGSCASGAQDEIVTTYEYESSNLLMTGMVVTAADTNGYSVAKRTCYQYDKLGRQIGETQPQANRSSCPRAI